MSIPCLYSFSFLTYTISTFLNIQSISPKPFNKVLMKKNKKIKNRRRVYYQPCFPLVSLLSLLTDIQQTVDSTRCIRVEQSHQWRNVNVLSWNWMENCVTWVMLNMTPGVLPTRMILVFIGHIPYSKRFWPTMREQLQVTFKKLETDNHVFWSSCLLRLKVSVVIYTAYDHYVSPIYKIDASFKS